ncbi:hypothetical protein [Deinococcus sp. S9]|uniref:hypothetical protein n=1 Tax=Deinococcus sp. S9 TaxID=2545754 RepID=UPI00105629A1|nr:hypothetical protein [Deinococcus sp. S9]TDE84686.1 hypothetical protein E0686_15810 [Deinococcus sp. S9]
MNYAPYARTLLGVLGVTRDFLRRRGIPLWVPFVVLFVLVAGCDWRAKHRASQGFTRSEVQAAVSEARGNCEAVYRSQGGAIFRYRGYSQSGDVVRIDFDTERGRRMCMSNVASGSTNLVP